MKSYVISENDEWTSDRAKVTSSENLAKIKRVLEEEAPVIVEHWFYRRSSCPERYIFDDFEGFLAYLNENARAGDVINIWNFGKVCTEENRLAYGKCPDDQDRVPKRGAY
jgi:hypothetical protein